MTTPSGKSMRRTQFLTKRWLRGSTIVVEYTEQPGYPYLRWQLFSQLLWPCAQPMGARSRSGRIVRRLSSGNRSRALLWIVGHRHRGIFANPRFLLRDRGFQAYVWSRKQSRGGATFLDSGPCRASVPDS